QSLDRGCEVVGVCRDISVEKLDAFKERMTIVPGAIDDRNIIKKSVDGYEGVLCVQSCRGMKKMSSRTAQAVLDFAEPGVRLVFSRGTHISMDEKDKFTGGIPLLPSSRKQGNTQTLWQTTNQTAPSNDYRRGGGRYRRHRHHRRRTTQRHVLEEGESDGLPVWSRHVGDPILASNLVRRVDFALHGDGADERHDCMGGAGRHRLPVALGAGARRRR
ncbi:unnamed protein product, partial [Phaeothamnion confervicola]